MCTHVGPIEIISEMQRRDRIMGGSGFVLAVVMKCMEVWPIKFEFWTKRNTAQEANEAERSDSSETMSSL